MQRQNSSSYKLDLSGVNDANRRRLVIPERPRSTGFARMVQQHGEYLNSTASAVRADQNNQPAASVQSVQVKSTTQPARTAKPAAKKPISRGISLDGVVSPASFRRAAMPTMSAAISNMTPATKPAMAMASSLNTKKSNTFTPAAYLEAKPVQTPVRPTTPEIPEPVESPADQYSDDDVNLMAGSDGVIAIAQPNIFERLASAKISINFKFNKERFLAGLRYTAIVVILAASAYLAWDTYSTNKTVQNNFSNPASAMSIAGVNPATADQTAVSQEAKQAYTVSSDLPRLITIPSIGVSARVRSVGVNSQGNIDVPKNLNDTAWYDGSAKPGQDGQVFIDGHTSFSNTIDAAFNDLPKMKAGDQIVVETGNGTKYTYRVTATETVNADKVDMGKALNVQGDSKKGITLMTCTGKFNYRTQTADKRFIVYGVQE